MEAFYASMSGVLATFGGLAFFYVALRKDLLHGLQKAEKDRLRIKTELEGDILRLEGQVIRLEDRVIRLDDRVREVEGDMKVVTYHLRITEGPPADPEPPRPRPARDESDRRESPAAPVPSKT